MKKTLLVSALALVAVSAQAQQNQAYTGEYDGKVRFEGEVIDQTCVVNPAKGDQYVKLDKVQATKLQGKGKVAGGKNFSISLQGCKTDSAHQLVRAEFRSSPNVDAANEYTLKNTLAAGANVASNVNLRLKESNGTAIRIGDASYTSTQYKNLNGQATGEIDYSVEYYATGNATVGRITSEVEYSIVYQ